MIETVSMAWIKAQARGHFFDDRTTKFFNSTYPNTGKRNGDWVYFWTGDRCGWAGDKVRAYTVRRLNLVTGQIETVGEFQQYPTVQRAKWAVSWAATNNQPEARKETT